MQLLYLDETNASPDPNRFFIYGGIIVDQKKVRTIHDQIELVRKRNSYNDNDILKFNSGERPQHISADKHTEVKQALIKIAQDNNVKYICSVVHHGIVNRDINKARQYEINRTCLNFNSYLSVIDDVGIAFIDVFSDSGIQKFIQEKASLGLAGLPNCKGHFKLRNIVGIHVSMIGTSHLCSLSDILLGSFRYAINSREKNPQISQLLIGQLKPCFIYEPSSDMVSNKSLFYSPKSIKVKDYFDEYQNLRAFLLECGLSTHQVPNYTRLFGV